MPLIMPNRFYQPRGAFDPSGSPPAFTGIGDVTASALAYHGLRAYNAAYATGSNPCLDIVDQAGNNQLTVNITSAGDLDTAAVSTWVTAHSVTTIKVKQLYDQIGTRHLVTPGASGTLADMPTLVLSGFGSHPVLRFSNSAANYLNEPTSAINQAEPFSVYTSAKRTAVVGSLDVVYGGTPFGAIYFATTNTAGLFNGSQVTFGSGSVTDNQFWTLQALFNGASCKGAYGTTVVTGLNAGGPNSIDEPGVSNSSFPAAMDWFEGCVWAGDKSANFTSHDSNAKAYWGY